MKLIEKIKNQFNIAKDQIMAQYELGAIQGKALKQKQDRIIKKIKK